MKLQKVYLKPDNDDQDGNLKNQDGQGQDQDQDQDTKMPNSRDEPSKDGLKLQTRPDSCRCENVKAELKRTLEALEYSLVSATDKALSWDKMGVKQKRRKKHTTKPIQVGRVTRLRLEFLAKLEFQLELG